MAAALLPLPPLPAPPHTPAHVAPPLDYREAQPGRRSYPVSSAPLLQDHLRRSFPDLHGPVRHRRGLRHANRPVTATSQPHNRRHRRASLPPSPFANTATPRSPPYPLPPPFTNTANPRFPPLNTAHPPSLHRALHPPSTPNPPAPKSPVPKSSPPNPPPAPPPFPMAPPQLTAVSDLVTYRYVPLRTDPAADRRFGFH